MNWFAVVVALVFNSQALAPTSIVRYIGKPCMSVAQFRAEKVELEAFLGRYGDGSTFVVASGIHPAPRGFKVLPFRWRLYRIYQRAA